MLGGTFCYQKKKNTQKPHTFSNKVAKISYLKSPFKKIATKIKKKKILSHPKPESKQRPRKRGRWCKKVNTSFTYFWSSKANVPPQINLSVFKAIPEKIRMITTPPLYPLIKSNNLKKRKKKGNKLLHLEVKVSKHQFKQISKKCMILKQTTW